MKVTEFFLLYENGGKACRSTHTICFASEIPKAINCNIKNCGDKLVKRLSIRKTLLLSFLSHLQLVEAR